jgi:hypothetical protein
LILCFIGPFKFGIAWDTGILSLSLLFNTILSVWNFKGAIS